MGEYISMINDFLKKYQEELISEKIQLKEDIDLLETKIKEETKFLNLLEESNDSYFKEFTPRDLNAKNNKKAEEVRALIGDLTKSYNDYIEKMKFFDCRLGEINSLLADTSTLTNNFTESNDANNDNFTDSTVNQKNITNSDLIGRLSNIKDLILLDPYRAQIELEKIISTI